MNATLTRTTDDVDARFRAQVAASPDRVALVDASGHQLSYRELDLQAGRVAEHLIARGFPVGGLAALLVERSHRAIVALLGVLRAGGGYMSLDPDHPPNRHRRILASSGASVLITSRRLAPDRDAPVLTVFLEDLERSLETADLVHFEARRSAGPDDLAYVINTSGSTGVPKGTLNSHRNVSKLVDALLSEVIGEARPLRVALVASFVFDASVQQIFTALLGGHLLHVTGNDTRAEGRRLIDFYRRHRIEWTDCAPAHLKMMTSAMEEGVSPPPTRRFLVGGEALTPETVNRFLGRFGASPPELLNLYGVAECGVDATVYRAVPAEIAALGFVPIGRELAHVEVLIRDDDGIYDRPEAVGELCLAGDSLGQGYLRQPRLTAITFVPHPRRVGARMYRTGDLGRRLPDGTLQFLGRRDRQVQLRGYRVELDEIEHQLLRCKVASDIGKSWAVSSSESCKRCLLNAQHPGVEIKDRVCNVCRRFESYRDHVEAYFRTPRDLSALVDASRRHKSASSHDALLLYSGGKDSTYALYRLLDMGLDILAFTFDNGYISSVAFENIRRTTERLGVEHVIGRVDAMREIFAASLEQESTVCSGCFRGLSTLSTAVACERGIPMIVTGLSRGQIFDTKLRALFDQGVRESEEIEHRLRLHRQFYHSRSDKIARWIGVRQRELSLDDIHFVDFFRYSDATLDQIRRELASRDRLWEAPVDTGLCSTNCRINDVGIYVHQLEQGFHNYIEPLSWDVRLGILTREEGFYELQRVRKTGDVEWILGEIGYEVRDWGRIRDVAVVARPLRSGDSELVAFYVADSEVSPKKLRDSLERELPAYMVPAHFEALDRMPVTRSGKKDYATLRARPLSGGEPRVQASGAVESRLLGLWQKVLEHDRFGVDDDFIEAGGDSLRAVLLTTLIRRTFGVEIRMRDAFERPTIRHIANLIHRAQTLSSPEPVEAR